MGRAPLLAAPGPLQLVVVAAFVALLAATARQKGVRGRTADLYIGAGLAWFLLSSVLDLRHLVLTLGAPDRASLLAEIAVWQLPLRDLQIHGLALSMLLDRPPRPSARRYRSCCIEIRFA